MIGIRDQIRVDLGQRDGGSRTRPRTPRANLSYPRVTDREQALALNPTPRTRRGSEADESLYKTGKDKKVYVSVHSILSWLAHAAVEENFG